MKYEKQSDVCKSTELQSDLKPARKNRWLAMLLSIIPGTGHMYLGLVRKGTALMALLFSLIFAVILLSDTSTWLAGYLIPTLCFLFLTYSIFDCLSLTERINSGMNLTNEGIYELTLLKELIIRKKMVFGFLLISAGIIGILNIFLSVTDFVIPLLLVLGGIFLLLQGRNKRHDI